MKSLLPSCPERWLHAAHKRVSVRRYAGSAPDEGIAALERLFPQETENVRLRFGQGNVFASTISGTDRFAALFCRTGHDIQAGYLSGALMLECAAMGLGTCYLGLSYKKKAVLSLFPALMGEELVGVISIGKATLTDQTDRKRKSVEKLTGLTAEEFAALPDWQKSAIACARIAPSAMNRQPWRIVVKPDVLTFRTAGNNFGYAGIDLGIALLHAETGAAAAGVRLEHFALPPVYSLVKK